MTSRPRTDLRAGAELAWQHHKRDWLSVWESGDWTILGPHPDRPNEYELLNDRLWSCWQYTSLRAAQAAAAKWSRRLAAQARL